MEEMKFSWQIGQMISTLSATLGMTYQAKIPSHPYVLVNRSVLCTEDEQLYITVHTININICDADPLDKSSNRTQRKWHCLT